MTIHIGAVADDFTGASDLASTLAREGMRVVQVIGTPDANTEYGEAEAVIIALKSRTAPVAQAVADSVAAQRWLTANGASQIIFKYCSTFDSTAQGNIGPVADALRASMATDFAFVCPAFPENGRTIYQGHLFVHNQLLSDSSMKDHPLTPMADANLMRLMDAQSEGRSGLIPHQVVVNGAQAILDAVNDLKSQDCVYGVIDAICVDDLRTIGAAARHHSLLTGGSGIAAGLPENLRRDGKISPARCATMPKALGRKLVLAGSCSTATRAQIEWASGKWPNRKIDMDNLTTNPSLIDDLCAWAEVQAADQPVLIYSSADPAEVAQTQQKYGVEQAGAAIENALGELASNLFQKGFNRIISAGGETSGAIVSALNVKALHIGPDIAPGVPWTESVGKQPLALALKSGNFGDAGFFGDAFNMFD